jgi:uncharacterized repeat protein (TIGR01451 family)
MITLTTQLKHACAGFSLRLWVLLSLTLAAMIPMHAQAQGAPFTCDVVFYQVRNPNNAGFTTESQLFGYLNINSSTAPNPVFGTPPIGRLNALGYNPVDNYMYALDASGGVGGVARLVRIGQGGYQVVGDILDNTGAAFVGFNPTAGAFDAAGRYYFSGQGTTNGVAASLAPNAIFRVDVIPGTGNMTAAQRYNFNVPNVMNVGDFDFNGAGGPAGLLLAASQQATYGGIRTMHQISLQPAASGTVGTASVATATIAGATFGGVGSAFWDAFASKFYVFDNDASTFWEILSPLSPSPSAVAITVPAPAVPYATNTNPTDGTSCPISGVRRADLEIIKSDPFTTVTTGQVTNYTVTVRNYGPYPANYSVVRDPAVAGITKNSVLCSAPGIPPLAVCPPVLSIAGLESPGGVQIITFPPGTTLVFTINATINAPAGSFASNVATVTPAIDTTDATLTNNISTDTNVVTTPNSQVVSSPSFCPAGTVESYVNFVQNGDFSSGTATNFATGAVTTGGLNSLALVGGTTTSFVSAQAGDRAYVGAPFVIDQKTFAGDPGRAVAGSNTWLLSNGKNQANYNIWQQNVTGLTASRVYQFMYYASNLTRGTNTPTVSVIQPLGPGALGATVSLVNEVAVTDTWTLVQRTITGVTSVLLGIQNQTANAATEQGDVLGITQIQLRECAQALNVSVSKTNSVTFLTANQTITYTITVSNNSTNTTAFTTTFIDPAATGLVKNTISCVVVPNTSTTTFCPAPATLTLLNVEGAGVTIPSIGAGQSVVFNIVAKVQPGTGGTTVTNVAFIIPVGYTDSNPADNQAQDADPVRSSVNLSITKTNTVTALVAGSTTSYSITVTNTGPDTMVNGIFKDIPTSGLQCTSITCASTGPALCPNPGGAAGELNVTNMTSAGGVIIPNMTPTSSLRFTVNCNVTATGQ